MYREEEGRGVRSGKLPAPRKIELSLSSTLKDILTLGRETFFQKSKPPLHSLCLADSSGQPIDISSDEWTIGNFYEQNCYQPSRFKLYIMYKPSVSIYCSTHKAHTLSYKVLFFLRIHLNQTQVQQLVCKCLKENTQMKKSKWTSIGVKHHQDHHHWCLVGINRSQRIQSVGHTQV